MLLDYGISKLYEHDEKGNPTEASQLAQAILEEILVMLMAIQFQEQDVREYKEERMKRIDRIRPKTVKELAQFIGFANKKAFDYVKENGGEYCPHCGYMVIMNENKAESSDAFGFKPEHLSCPMCHQWVRDIKPKPRNIMPDIY
jgi:hypothetical protein